VNTPYLAGFNGCKLIRKAFFKQLLVTDSEAVSNRYIGCTYLDSLGCMMPKKKHFLPHYPRSEGKCSHY
jgi:hypothetical protein